MKLRSTVLRFSLTSSLIATSLILTACGGSEGDTSTDDSMIVTTPSNDGSFFTGDSNFDYADSMLGKFLGFFRSASVVTSGFQTKRTIAAVTDTSIPCDSGSVDYSITSDDATAELTGVSVNFNNCRQGIETTTGGISISGQFDSTGENGAATITATNFSVTGGADPIGLNGSASIGLQANGSVSTFSISGPSLSMTSGSENIVLSDYSVTAIDNESTDAFSLSASLTLASNVDGTITVNIAPALTGDGQSDYPLAGRLVMTHSDGSSLTMDADNGDPNTFNYTINENGSISSGVANWADTELADL